METFPTSEGYGTGVRNLREIFQYYYHPDHLGSTSYATDISGEVYQHLEYFPFGEIWANEVTNNLRVPHRFTGKELDEETQLYYFGARYYDPRTSVWQSPDPALGGYLNESKAKLTVPSYSTGWQSYLAGRGMGGMFEPQNLNGFGYGHQNPLVLVDPDGNLPWKSFLVKLFDNGTSKVGRGLSKREAVLARRQGNSTWSRSKQAARAIQ